MTPRGFLMFIAELRGLGGKSRARIDEVIAKVNLQNVLDVPIETLSKGYKRRVGLAQAILHDPQVLVLDEPTDGLDPNQKHEVRALIRSMAHDKVVILSTHILEEVEALCTRTIIISSGKLVVDCTPVELAAKSRFHNAVSLTVPKAQRERVEKSLVAMSQVSSCELGHENNSHVTLIAFSRQGNNMAAEIGAKARDERWELDELRVESGRLDDVFRNLTGFGKVAAN
jgi:ABC-2 type transport system ATP-binding protein